MASRRQEQQARSLSSASTISEEQAREQYIRQAHRQQAGLARQRQQQWREQRDQEQQEPMQQEREREREQQQQQQQQPSVRRTLFSGSLARRGPVTSTSSAPAPDNSNVQPQTQAQRQIPPRMTHTNSDPAPFVAGGPKSGFSPAPTLTHTVSADGTGAPQDADIHNYASTRGSTAEVDAEADGILVVESGGGVGDSKSASPKKASAPDNELLLVCLEEAAAAAADSGGGNGRDNGEAAGEGAEDDPVRLIEMYRSHARQRIDPNELKPAVQEVLRRKVAALEDDKWMYEVESGSEDS